MTYAYPWRDIVAAFKFQGQPGWARHLAGWMLQSVETRRLLKEAYLLAPVPLTQLRLRERGYNQAWELVKHLRQANDAPEMALPNLLVRSEQTQLQHTLDRAKRLENIRHAFSCRPEFTEKLFGRRVLLVDDVMTTGATLQAAAEVLVEAGATGVSALVFARTPAPGSVE
jgi:ComF family protein